MIGEILWFEIENLKKRQNYNYPENDERISVYHSNPPFTNHTNPNRMNNRSEHILDKNLGEQLFQIQNQFELVDVTQNDDSLYVDCSGDLNISAGF